MTASIFTDEQLKVLAQRFKEFDLDNNGVLGRDEVAQILETEGDFVDRLMVVLLFEKYDKNKDGFIDLNEFIDFCSHVESRDKEFLLREIFMICDTDRNRYLDLNEVIRLGGLMGIKITRQDASDTLKNLDQNNDRKISVEEFLAIIGNAE